MFLSAPDKGKPAVKPGRKATGLFIRRKKEEGGMELISSLLPPLSSFSWPPGRRKGDRTGSGHPCKGLSSGCFLVGQEDGSGERGSPSRKSGLPVSARQILRKRQGQTVPKGRDAKPRTFTKEEGERRRDESSQIHPSAFIPPPFHGRRAVELRKHEGEIN
jgi:hypothetical protein